jgi:sterol desaturase/sphingolipid hydroxylase (fatty acid hydroxylase superfamily)
MRLFDAAVQPIVRMSATRANSLGSLIVDVVVAFALIVASLGRADVHAIPALATVAIGLLLFSFVEYCFHRWMFHGSMKVFEEGHQRHHRDPLGDHSMPFFLPPVMLLMLAGIFDLAMPTGYALLLAGAMATGYAAYGLSHCAIHYMRFRNPRGKRWAARHHIHHHHPDRNFGVTTSLWDMVLGTRYVSNRTRT